MVVGQKQARRISRDFRTTHRRFNPLNHQISYPAKLNIGRDIRKAYVKTTPGAVETVACYLDVDTTGAEVTVTCSVIGGNALNAAVPRLADGELIFVSNIGGTWYCLTTFQASQDC